MTLRVVVCGLNANVFSCLSRNSNTFFLSFRRQYLLVILHCWIILVAIDLSLDFYKYLNGYLNFESALSKINIYKFCYVHFKCTQLCDPIIDKVSQFGVVVKSLDQKLRDWEFQSYLRHSQLSDLGPDPVSQPQETGNSKVLKCCQESCRKLPRQSPGINIDLKYVYVYMYVCREMSP